MADERIGEGIWYFVVEFIIETPTEPRRKDRWPGNYVRVLPEEERQTLAAGFSKESSRGVGILFHLFSSVCYATESKRKDLYIFNKIRT